MIPLLMVVSDGILAGVALDRTAQCRSRRHRWRPARHAAGDRAHARARRWRARWPCRLVTSATFVWLGSGYLPTSASATSVGDYVRWQLGWGLTDLQAAALVGLGLAGAVAWSRGTVRGAIAGYGGF